MSQSAQRIATTTQHVPDYDPTEIEPRWRSRWDADRLYRTPDDDDERPPYFLLTMLPYTSGDLHIGHWYAMAPSDVAARWKRMQGFNVMFPRRLRRVRPARRKRRDPEQDTPQAVDLRQH